MKFKVLWIAGLMLAATAGQAQASFVTIANFSGSETVETFAGQTSATNPWTLNAPHSTARTPSWFSLPDICLATSPVRRVVQL